MSAYASMKSKLEPLGLYTFAGGGVVDSELKTYAAELDSLSEALDELERESFIATAETYGLSERERFADRERGGMTVAERRARLLGAEKSACTDASAAGFRQFLSDCGLTDFSVVEHPGRQRVNVYINDSLSPGEQALMSKKIAQAAPAHLDVPVAYA